MRLWVQLACLGLFSALFALSPYSEKLPLPADLFLKADPLLGMSAWLASRRFHESLLWGLPVLASALIFGRFFCGWICPLGTLFDVCRGKSSGRKSPVPIAAKRYLLVVILAAAVFSLNISGVLDPIALLTRMFTFIAYPAAMLLAASGIAAARPLADYLHLVTLSHAQVSQPAFSLMFLTLLIAAVLFALNYRFHRFWCRGLCPLGALLGAVSRVSFLKRAVRDGCTRCGKCIKNCPTGAISENPRDHDQQECIGCLTCRMICPARSIAFSPGVHAAATKPDVTRRGILAAAAAGAFTSLAAARDAGAKASEVRLIRPPGALPEPQFQAACVRCGQCMKICPTNTLQPCLFEAGVAGIWSPRLNTRVAGCDQTCADCGKVCPTGAIRTLPLEEKKHARLGTAALDRDRCLVWAQDRLCLICDEQCPYNAIIFKWKDGMRRPYVVDAKCNGCGFCEQVCPVQGRSAIEVSQQGEIRLATGSYVEKARELHLDFKEEPGDDSFLQEPAPGELPEGISK